MREYRRAKIKALERLREEGRKRGYEPEIDYNELVLYERPRLLARTRASAAQRGSLNFKVNDEVRYDGDNFRNVYSIILDLHAPDTWNSLDSFYPLTLRLIRDLATEDINGDHPVTINLSDPRVKCWENSIERLFPSEGGVKPPADRINDDHTQKLNDIAKGL